MVAQGVNLGCLMAESTHQAIGLHTMPGCQERKGRVFAKAVDVGMKRGQRSDREGGSSVLSLTDISAWVCRGLGTTEQGG